MAGNVDDFMRRFGGEGTLDDREAAKYHDRFVSTHDEDRDFDNKTYHEGATEYLGKLPDNEFRTAARNAVSQAPPQEREGLLGGILGALGGSTGDGGGATAGLGGLSGIAKMLGLGSTDPRQMDDDDAAKVMNYARKERPEVLRQTVEEKPWFVKAMGNPIVMGALTVVATKLLGNRRR
jgi:hypothetical protein